MLALLLPCLGACGVGNTAVFGGLPLLSIGGEKLLESRTFARTGAEEDEGPTPQPTLAPSPSPTAAPSAVPSAATSARPEVLAGDRPLASPTPQPSAFPAASPPPPSPGALIEWVATDPAPVASATASAEAAATSP